MRFFELFDFFGERQNIRPEDNNYAFPSVVNMWKTLFESVGIRLLLGSALTFHPYDSLQLDTVTLCYIRSSVLGLLSISSGSKYLVLFIISFFNDTLHMFFSSLTYSLDSCGFSSFWLLVWTCMHLSYLLEAVPFSLICVYISNNPTPCFLLAYLVFAFILYRLCSVCLTVNLVADLPRL